MQQKLYALGQRWLSNTEAELGLGTVVELGDRTVTLLFPASGESRHYASKEAPLIRITFAPEDEAKHVEGWEFTVAEVLDNHGQLTYQGTRLDTGEAVSVKETFLDHNFQINAPLERLNAGQFDHPKWFDLRQQALMHRHQHQVSPLLGVVGARVDLIPHQLHIANQVANRYAPRVLLADEVGLGKTIEAALIIHQQLMTGRAQRVLIVVPDSLVHQWLVEMLRRVNLAFAIFDEERCESLAEQGGNPFETEQLILCSLDFLTHNTRAFQQALAAEWDLLVVDEAHHLSWSPDHVSQEYQLISELADVTKGVLLLTATPDQLGHESHFARLRLLDADRFHDYQQFLAEEREYAPLAKLISPLLQDTAPSAEETQALQTFCASHPGLPSVSDLDNSEDRQKLLEELLDRHGTGRLLFRNSRSGVAGFPARHLHQYPLALPELYQSLTTQTNALDQLTPEALLPASFSWSKHDPRVAWFIELLQELKGKKVLTICAKANTAMQLAEALRVQSGIRATVFHEGMSIVERDKAAHYFAQSEDGAQVLICSEIGSEGRNFQFSHHLVLFDLPKVPDLLEQRIGRLDRIGQRNDVNIHVPYFSNTPQEIMLNWYHQGLNAFEQTCPIGAIAYDELEEQLQESLQAPEDSNLAEALIDQTQQVYQALKQQLEQGRDRLLELNSSGRGKVEPFLQTIQDAEDSPTLERFMTRLFDAIGIMQEERDESSYFLSVTEKMVSHLPGLHEEGMTITYERETATQLEHLHFLSWDHPLVNNAMDMVLMDVLGKCSVALHTDKSLPAGYFWLECLFVLSGKAERHLQLNRFLPPTPIPICIDARGGQHSDAFIELQKVKYSTGRQLCQALNKQINACLQMATQVAEEKAGKLRKSTGKQVKTLLGNEHQRLTALREVNPAIRDEELEHIANQQSSLLQAIADSGLRLEALRLVVNNP